MEAIGLLVTLEARAGKEADAEAFLRSASHSRLWAGQSANLSTCTDVSAFLSSLVEEVSEIAGSVIQWSANHSRSAREPGKEK